uniref:Uncharacterized protein n=1 Tax=Acrobeloides nanus TaxID=290746 RepID=A0A914EA87_9BILA
MFEEEEPGKPKDWKCTIGVIIFVSIINLSIFIVIRVLLDSENEFDEPIIQGIYDPTEEEHVRQYSNRPNKLEIPTRQNNHNYSIDLPKLNYIDVPLQLMTPSTTTTINPSKNLDQGKDNKGYSTAGDIFREIV